MYKERLDYELSIILECIVCQFHRSLAMRYIRVHDISSVWDVLGAWLRAHERSRASHWNACMLHHTKQNYLCKSVVYCTTWIKLEYNVTFMPYYTSISSFYTILRYTVLYDNILLVLYYTISYYIVSHFTMLITETILWYINHVILQYSLSYNITKHNII